MSRLVYTKVGESYECIERLGSGRSLAVILPEDTVGTVGVGGKRAQLNDGGARIDLGTLADGEYVLYLYTDTKSVALDTLVLLGKDLSTVITKNKYYTLVKRCYTQSREIEKIKERLKAIEGKVFDSVIF